MYIDIYNICIFVWIGNSKLYKIITMDLILRAQHNYLV